MRPKSRTRVAVALTLWLATACADQSGESVGPAFPVPDLTALQVQPMSLTYDITRVTDGGYESFQGTRRMDIDLVDYESQAAVRLIGHHDRVYGTDDVDTLWVAQDDLRPLARRWQRGQWQHGHSVVQGNQHQYRNWHDRFPDDTRERVEEIPEGPYVISRDHMFLIFHTLPFAEGWTGSLPHERYDAMDFMVIGDSVITVKAGTFDVWIVQATANYRHANWSQRYFFTWWVAKDSHVLVKTDSYFFEGFRDENDYMVVELASMTP